MKVIKFSIALIPFFFNVIIPEGRPTSRTFSFPTELYPSQAIQKAIKKIFTAEFIDQINDTQNIINLGENLAKRGFKVLQYVPGDYKSAIVVEHSSLPGYVIKFSRTSDIIVNIPFPKKAGSIKRQSDLRIRVENARKIQDIVRKNGISTVKVPQKYLMYIKRFPVVIAEKINLPKQEIPLKMMNGKQIDDLLFIVKASNGILDLKPKNIIFDGTYIYFIDTERVEQTSASKLQGLLKRSIKEFKETIDQRYIKCVEEWFLNLTKKDSAPSDCWSASPHTESVS